MIDSCRYFSCLLLLNFTQYSSNKFYRQRITRDSLENVYREYSSGIILRRAVSARSSDQLAGERIGGCEEKWKKDTRGENKKRKKGCERDGSKTSVTNHGVIRTPIFRDKGERNSRGSRFNRETLYSLSLSFFLLCPTSARTEMLVAVCGRA